MTDLFENITCVHIGHGKLNCNGTIFVEDEGKLTYKDEWFWIYLGIYVALVLFAGLMSGLTMGLLSLDTTSLHVLVESGTPSQQRNAKKILPIVKRHHLLLVTLLLANAAAVESMPLFLDQISDPVTAICVSVTAVLLFGEVFPQALCTRFGLAIGASLTWVVYFFMGLFFIIAWPLSKLLDFLLGEDHGTFFRRAELKALVGLHGPRKDEEDNVDGGEDPPDKLTEDEVLIIKGALDMRYKCNRDAMMPIENVFMLHINAVMDRKTMDMVLEAGHSRVPVYEDQKENILGILLVKRLIKLDPDDNVPVKSLLKDESCFKEVPFISATKPLFDMLNEFQQGRSHMSVVVDMPDESSSQDLGSERVHRTKVIGIISLEDVIEELLQEEIIDETDVYVDVQRKIQIARAKASKFNRSGERKKSFRQSLSDEQNTLQAPASPSSPAGNRNYGSTNNLLNTSDTAPLLNINDD